MVLIHEYGWNCFSLSQTSMAAITITHGCMSKSERSGANNALVYSFIPTSQLLTDSPHKFDALLKPLLEELFIIGEEIFFRSEILGVSEENDCPTLRVLPLLVTADSKAHHEIGLTSAGGHRGCRRCHIGGTYVPEKHHYYYGSFQKWFWTPCPPRSAIHDCMYAW